MPDPTPTELIAELTRGQAAGDLSVLDDIVAPDLVNHAAGPQGREGLRQILETIDHDLGPLTFDEHHLLADGDHVVQHLTVHGTHRASTMPLLSGTTPDGREVAWTFIHVWRIVDGQIVEHWACRNDMGLREQIGGR